jgi:hypothetical protein
MRYGGLVVCLLIGQAGVRRQIKMPENAEFVPWVKSIKSFKNSILTRCAQFPLQYNNAS